MALSIAAGSARLWAAFFMGVLQLRRIVAKRFAPRQS
jgi:hypothetical protein